MGVALEIESQSEQHYGYGYGGEGEFGEGSEIDMKNGPHGWILYEKTLIWIWIFLWI